MQPLIVKETIEQAIAVFESKLAEIATQILELQDSKRLLEVHLKELRTFFLKQEGGADFVTVTNGTALQTTFIEDTAPTKEIILPKQIKSDEFIIEVIRQYGKLIRKKEFDGVYQSVSGTNNSMKYKLRLLRGDGKLEGTMFKNDPAYTYFGLPEWTEIDATGKRVFKKAYVPDEMMPYYNTQDLDYAAKLNFGNQNTKAQ